MRPVFCLLIFILAIDFFSLAQTDIGGARISGMGNTQVAITDLFSQNQGGLALLEKHEIGIFSRQRFQLKELSQLYANGVYVSKWGNFGLKTFYSGHPDFNKAQVGLAYGKKLSNTFSGGVQVNMHQYAITNYGTSSFFSFELGFRAALSKHFDLGFHLFNPTSTTLNKDNGLTIQSKPAIDLGISYRQDNYLISTEVSKEGNNVAPNLKLGIEYTFYKALFVRLGLNTTPSLLSFGVGTQWENLKMDISYSYHQLLGSTPGISLSYVFNKDEK